MTLLALSNFIQSIKKRNWLICLGLGMGLCFALNGSGECVSQYTTLLNPYTGRFDFVNNISTGSVLSGSAFRTVDSNSCLWDISVSTPGNLVTTLVSCPAVAQFTACVPGTPYGLLLAVTCPR